MAYQIPFHRDVYVLPDQAVPQNSQSQTPVRVTLVPPSGPDLARLKSVVYANTGLMDQVDDNWTREQQLAVISAFETGVPVFINTVLLVENLSVPAGMAKQAGIIPTLPTKPDQEAANQTIPDFDASIQIRTGHEFAMVAGYLPVIAFYVAIRLLALSGKLSNLDARLFAPPGGSGATATPDRTSGAARPARRTKGSRKRATAGATPAPENP